MYYWTATKAAARLKQDLLARVLPLEAFPGVEGMTSLGTTLGLAAAAELPRGFAGVTFHADRLNHVVRPEGDVTLAARASGNDEHWQVLWW